MYLEIDECSEGTHDCSQVCTNTNGSFICGCNSSYLLDIDGSTCNGMIISIAYIPPARDINPLHPMEKSSEAEEALLFPKNITGAILLVGGRYLIYLPFLTHQIYINL